MATIRKRRDKYQVQVRRNGSHPVSKSFHVLKDAQTWARVMEAQADRGALPDLSKLERITLGELVTRYRDTVSVRKRCAPVERVILNAFLLHDICCKRLSEICAADFAGYRDQRLRAVKPVTLKRDFNRLRHMFNVARDEWGLPIKETPLAKLQFKGADERRERRLQPGEFDRLMIAAKACRNRHVETIIRFALETAMRRGEILAIRRRHILILFQLVMIREATENARPHRQGP
jgi:integrase